MHMIILGSLFVSTNSFGFVASNIITSMIFGRAIMSVFPHIIVKPSKSSYSQIASYFSTNPQESRLLIFPEGMLSYYRAICKFRSGAFITGYPVQPIIIKYKQNIFNLLGFDMLCQEQIDVEVYVCDPIETNGSAESIEKIRKQMATLGNFFLSDVSNRSNQIK